MSNCYFCPRRPISVFALQHKSLHSTAKNDNNSTRWVYERDSVVTDTFKLMRMVKLYSLSFPPPPAAAAWCQLERKARRWLQPNRRLQPAARASMWSPSWTTWLTGLAGWVDEKPWTVLTYCMSGLDSWVCALCFHYMPNGEQSSLI